MFEEFNTIDEGSPRNHHFIPQHFLETWKGADDKLLVYRYEQAIDRYVTSRPATRSFCAVYDLYAVSYLKKEYETSVFAKVDDAGIKVLRKVRDEKIQRANLLLEEEKESFLRYIADLVLRNPVSIKQYFADNEATKTIRSRLKTDEERAAFDFLMKDSGNGYSYGSQISAAISFTEIDNPVYDVLRDGTIAFKFLKKNLLLCSDIAPGKLCRNEKGIWFLPISPSVLMIVGNPLFADNMPKVVDGRTITAEEGVKGVISTLLNTPDEPVAFMVNSLVAKDANCVCVHQDAQAFFTLDDMNDLNGKTDLQNQNGLDTPSL